MGPVLHVTRRPLGIGRWARSGTSAVFVIALLGALAVFHQQWADPVHRVLGSAGHINDPMQSMWFLGWVPEQLLHGHNPLTTNRLYYPGGVSLAWNTFMPTLGVLAAPVTLTLGPAFAFGLLMTLAPVMTSVTGYWWLRRHVTRTWPAVAGGLLLGFDPYMSGHLLGHLNLTFVALLPIMLMLTEDVLWRHPRPDRRSAAYLGLVTAAQAGISEELILITLIAVAVAVVAALLVAPAVRPGLLGALRSSWRSALLAIVVFLVAAAPLLIDQLFVARAVPLQASHWHAVAGDYLATRGRQLLTLPGHFHTIVGAAEDGAYLGPLLIAVLVLAVVSSIRRDALARVGVITALVCVVLTFGVTGPWAYLQNLPILKSVLPVRFSFATFLVLAWLCARWLDQLSAAARPGPAGGTSRTRALASTGIAALVLGLLTLTPAPVGSTSLPARVAFFHSAVAHQLGARGPVLLLPVPNPYDASGMYYQQQAGFAFAQPGGYALRPDGRGAAYGPPTSPLVQLATTPGAPADRLLAAGRAQLSAQGYGSIVVVDASRQAERLRTLAERLAGRPADWMIGGVHLWLLPRR